MNFYSDEVLNYLMSAVKWFSFCYIKVFQGRTNLCPRKVVPVTYRGSFLHLTSFEPVTH